MKKVSKRYTKYVPNEFDKNSHEEVFALLKKQTELIERKGLSITQQIRHYLPSHRTVAFNHVFNDEVTPYHNHDFYEINYVIDGVLAQYIEGKQILMRKGELLLMPLSVFHASYPIGEAKAINILMPKEFVEGMEKKMSASDPSNYLKYMLKRPVFLIFKKTEEYGIDRIISELTNSNYLNEKFSAYVNNISTNLVEKLLITLTACKRHDHISQNQSKESSDLERDERILQYLSEHYNESSLESVAKQFGYSTQQIRRIITRRTGYSYITFIKNIRLNNSMRLLSTTNLPIHEIAKIVGVESAEYFSRWFKMERDISPTEYRENRLSINNKQKTEDYVIT